MISTRVLRPFNGEKNSVMVNGTEKTGHPQTKEWRLSPTLCHKQKLTRNWYWKKLTIRAKTIKLLENIAQNFHDIRFVNEFLAMTPKA